MSKSQVAIIIVNWNAGSQLRDCLISIERFCADTVKTIIIIDNGSTDGSAYGLEGRFNLPISVIRNKENLGFAAACNQGAALVAAPYLLFLNPDTRLFDRTLDSALAVFDMPGQHDIGIVGVQLVDESGAVARTCARFPRLRDYTAQIFGLTNLNGFSRFGVHLRGWAHNETKQVDHVIGAFYLVRHDLFNLLSGFDELFFVYLEDLEFSLRAHQAGYRSGYLSDVQAFHAGGGTSRQVKAYRLFYSLRSRLLYGFKHFPASKAWILVALTTFIEPVTRVGFCLLQRDWSGVGNTIKGYLMLFGDMVSILKSRNRSATSEAQREVEK